MIFSDMDGTLLKNEGISPKNKDAILRAKEEHGVEFVLCTGRGFFGVKSQLRDLGLDGKKGFAICQNGSTIYDLERMETIIRRSFSPKLMVSVSELADEMKLETYYYDNLIFMAQRETDHIRRYMKAMRTDVRYLTDPGSYDGEFTKCLISGPRESLNRLRAEISHLEETELDVFFSGSSYMELVKKGVNKGNAMAEIAEKVGVGLHEVIAVGDSDNDLSMIQRAGLGVAVANADEAVKRAAKYVTENSCETDAVAEMIHKFILNPSF